MRSLRVRLIGIAYLIMWRVTRVVPESWAMAMFRMGFDRSYRRNHRQRQIAADNLRPIVGDGPHLDATVKEAFRSYGRYWAEAFRLQDMSKDELARRVDFDGAEVLDAAKAGGGCVLGVAHVGNWDAVGRYAAERWSLAAVVEVLKPRALFERFVAYRRALGMTIIPLERGRDVTAQCVDLIKRTGTMLALVCDRDLSGSGIPVTMFGRTTRLPAGPAVIAMRAGVPLIPGVTWQLPDGRWYGRAYPPISTGNEPETPQQIAAVMQRLADVFEQILREHPEQWHCFAPYWTDAQP